VGEPLGILRRILQVGRGDDVQVDHRGRRSLNGCRIERSPGVRRVPLPFWRVPDSESTSRNSFSRNTPDPPG
jgi:hypothetical protein